VIRGIPVPRDRKETDHKGMKQIYQFFGTGKGKESSCKVAIGTGSGKYAESLKPVRKDKVNGKKALAREPENREPV
jgi:hypothetical protein